MLVCCTKCCMWVTECHSLFGRFCRRPASKGCALRFWCRAKRRASCPSGRRFRAPSFCCFLVCHCLLSLLTVELYHLMCMFCLHVETDLYLDVEIGKQMCYDHPSSFSEEHRPRLPTNLALSCLPFRSIFVVFDLEKSFVVPDGMPCVVLWRPEALDCRVLIPPETWDGHTVQGQLPVWDLSPRPRASESRPLSQFSYRRICSPIAAASKKLLDIVLRNKHPLHLLKLPCLSCAVCFNMLLPQR